MGKNQSASGLTNVIQYNNGNITFVSGSTTLMSISSSGAITTTGVISGSNVLTASYANNAELLDGLDSTAFATTGAYSATSGSLYTVSSSAYATSGSLSTASGSFNTRVSALEATGSALSSSILSVSSSAYATSGSLSDASGSFNTRVATIESKYATTGSNNFRSPQYVSDTTVPTGFSNTTGSIYTDGGLQVTKDSYFSSSMFIKGNLTIYGTQSVAYITSSQLNIATNLITVNTATPSVRFGGLAVYDSGSTGTGATGSLLWDSQNNGWVYQRESGSTYAGGMLISGPRRALGSNLGDEQGLTACMIPVAQGGDHITSSLIYHDSSVTCIPGAIIGGTMSGTTIYGSTAICSPVGKFTTCIDAGTGTFSGALQGDYLVVGTVAATSGGLRLGTQVAIRARNVANTANIPLIESTAADGVSVSNGALIITCAGRVGIGQTAPGVALSVAGQSETWQLAFTTATGTSGALIGSPSANVLAFGLWSGTETMRINSTGTVQFTSDDNSGNRTTLNDVLTITQTNGNAPYSGFGSGILFKGTTYNGGGAGIPATRSWGKIGMQITDSSFGNTGENMIFQVAALDNSDTLTTALTLAYNGAATFSGDLCVSTAGSTAVLFDGTNPTITLRRNNNGNASAAINFKGSSAVKWQIGTNQATGLGFEINEGDATANKFYIAPGGASTFACSVFSLRSSIGTGTSDDADISLNVSAPSGVGKYIMFGRNGSNVAVMALSSGGALSLSGSGTTGVDLAASTYSYSIDLPNNQFIRQKNAAGTLGLLLGMSSDNTTYLRGFNGVALQVNNGTSAMTISSTSVVNIGGTGVLEVGSTGLNGKLGIRFGGSAKSGIDMRDDDDAANVTFQVYRKADGTNIGSITRPGLTNAVAFNTSSDYRLKEDLKQINGLEKVAAIKVYDFKWKGLEDRMDGVIAHELQEIIPYAVYGEKDGEEMQGVDYSKLVPILIKSIQEQQCTINTLKTCLGIS